MAGNAQLTTKIEQVVLNVLQRFDHRTITQFCAHQADGRVELVDRAIGFYSRVVFINAGSVTQTGGARVAGFGVDL